MKVVIDTNVVVSALLTPNSKPWQVMLVILSRKATLLIDERILSEYRDVLSREKFGFDLSAIENWLQFFADEGILVTPEPLSLIIPDRTDLPFLEVATAGRADYLVTGNIRHFPKTIATKLGLTIISPAQFMDMNKLYS